MENLSEEEIARQYKVLIYGENNNIVLSEYEMTDLKGIAKNVVEIYEGDSLIGIHYSNYLMHIGNLFGRRDRDYGEVKVKELEEEIKKVESVCGEEKIRECEAIVMMSRNYLNNMIQNVKIIQMNKQMGNEIGGGCCTVC